MDEIGQLRIYVSEKHFPVYQELGRTLFSQNSDFFIFCVFAGSRLNQAKEFSKKQELCRAVTLSEHDWISLKSVYFNNHGEVGTYKEMTQLAEKYAHAGITHMINNELKEYLIQDEAERYRLKGNLDELQMQIMEYVLKSKEEAPF
ncbi:hypothetical protein [Neobacillus drentensis]|uniref:hypothetical protein n=1 Tax=Neobacillus drentensis TaxID=220684 RepID=UPI002860E561|nr:hypothetical protein [Neobacillus drentensis]MDR7240494.1 hypothetical protein [Neobacillus drentensis]